MNPYIMAYLLLLNLQPTSVDDDEHYHMAMHGVIFADVWRCE